MKDQRVHGGLEYVKRTGGSVEDWRLCGGLEGVCRTIEAVWWTEGYVEDKRTSEGLWFAWWIEGCAEDWDSDGTK
jgi:hypothetical protein